MCSRQSWHREGGSSGENPLRTDRAEELTKRLSGFYEVIVSVSFVANGMMVDVFAFRQVLAFRIVITILAIISKVLDIAFKSGARTASSFRIMAERRAEWTPKG